MEQEVAAGIPAARVAVGGFSQARRARAARRPACLPRLRPADAAWQQVAGSARAALHPWRALGRRTVTSLAAQTHLGTIRCLLPCKYQKKCLPRREFLLPATAWQYAVSRCSRALELCTGRRDARLSAPSTLGCAAAQAGRRPRPGGVRLACRTMHAWRRIAPSTSAGRKSAWPRAGRAGMSR